MSKLRRRVEGLERRESPEHGPKIIYLSTPEGGPQAALSAFIGVPSITREDGETEADFIARCESTFFPDTPGPVIVLPKKDDLP